MASSSNSSPSNATSCAAQQQVNTTYIALLARVLEVHGDNNEKLCIWVEKTLKLYQMSRVDMLAKLHKEKLTPACLIWRIRFEQKYFWMLGGRPSALLLDLLNAPIGDGGVPKFSKQQQARFREMHRQAISIEQNITEKTKNLHFDFNDQFFDRIRDGVLAVLRGQEVHTDSDGYNLVERIDSLASNWIALFEEAEALRGETLKKISVVMTPKQALEFFITFFNKCKYKKES